MSGEDRQYWPTDVKLQELREQGILPYSQIAARCAAGLAALGMIYLASGELPEARSEILKALAYPVASEAFVTSIGNVLVRTILVPTAAIAVAILVIGLLQTRFWFGFVRLKFDLLKIAPRISILNPFRIVGASLVKVAVTGSVLGLGLGGAYWGAQTLLPLLNARQEKIPHWLMQVSYQVTLLLLGFFIVVGGIGFIAGQMAFRAKNRMTKAELEQESRG